MKKIILTLLVPTFLLAYQPAHPPAPLELVTSPPEPDPLISPIVPAVAIGAIVVGGIAWAGFHIADAIMNIWEHKLTNSPPPGVVFTAPVPQQPTLQGFQFDGEESGQ